MKVVDMRWGVRDEATDDHMTTELCMREISNCQRLSMGPNFVVYIPLAILFSLVHVTPIRTIYLNMVNAKFERFVLFSQNFVFVFCW